MDFCSNFLLGSQPKPFKPSVTFFCGTIKVGFSDYAVKFREIYPPFANSGVGFVWIAQENDRSLLVFSHILDRTRSFTNQISKFFYVHCVYRISDLVVVVTHSAPLYLENGLK